LAKRVWDDLITEQDREVYASGVFGGETGIGRHPAVVVVDVLNKSIGDQPLPILEAIKRYGKSCTGEYGWAAIPHIRETIEAARAGGFEVVYTIPQAPAARPAETLARFEEKMPGWMDYKGERNGYTFADEIAPLPGDIIIEKPTASSFYRTDLEERLHAAGVDCLIVTGGATSGCVRATVVDAHARGFKINVVEDGVFDRGQVTHAMNLFDMWAKYADVIGSSVVVQRLSAIASPAATAS
jgi:nicotinamidase-related amidase